MITGTFALNWPSGHDISMTGAADENGVIYFCRRGHSDNKPFCDNSHKGVGFKSIEGDATIHHD